MTNKLELGARDLLLLDGEDLADAMRRIDHELVGLEALTLRRDLARLLDANRRTRLHDLADGRLDRRGSRRRLRRDDGLHRRLDLSLGDRLGRNLGGGLRSGDFLRSVFGHCAFGSLTGFRRRGSPGILTGSLDRTLRLTGRRLGGATTGGRGLLALGTRGYFGHGF